MIVCVDINGKSFALLHRILRYVNAVLIARKSFMLASVYVYFCMSMFVVKSFIYSLYVTKHVMYVM